jgi:hypothetical protein
MQGTEKYAVTKRREKLVPTKFRNARIEVLMTVATKVSM